MSKFLEKLPTLSLWVLFAISIVISLLFLFGGSEEVIINNNPWDQPLYTDALLNWSYILLGLAILITIIVTLVQFIASFKANPKKGLTSVGVVILFVGVFVVSWFLGTGDTLYIIGYEGTDNSGFWAQFTDMCVYSMYILFVATILTIFATVIYSKIKNK
ncbi:MAG TPA: hypothetical protein PLJ40_01775 [Paludibacteraceae bacterium]|nr:hypothetical protein [Paludibacteraceae bacterium]HQB68885.1 hypothetical protein [Paludibacteraceae bacterium]HRS67151.1 hypothetical protein [Paludibacteraceae bacterium]